MNVSIPRVTEASAAFQIKELLAEMLTEECFICL